MDINLNIRVSDIMTSRIVTIEMDDRLTVAKEIFDNAPFHHLLVIEHNKLRGILSERDYLRALSPNIGNINETERDSETLQKRAHQVMTRSPVTIAPNQTIKQAGELLLQHDIGSLPVLDKGKLVGIITWKDLLKAFVA
ncbi:CBS domain-containing protein [Shewanella violacea]|uniref:Acetoin utilization protein AcuB, putative n=1 Tax=Shewanella violacea (strain JCM 10179 / CIP 106290 / LMG 19151 / DSS12) TaxID=637905 RepID=D4ZB22_SHEVD|nr:acetoin utilization protein AcuB, putative [Shewanella violacea DSS12]